MAASSPGNPPAPESLLSEHLAPTGWKQHGEIGFPKFNNLLLLQTFIKPKLGFSAGTEVQEIPFKLGFRFGFKPSMRNLGGKKSVKFPFISSLYYSLGVS